MNIHTFNKALPTYNEQIGAQDVLDQFIDWLETIQRYHNMFNFNIGFVKNKVEPIDQGDTNAIAQAGGKLSDIEDWLQIFNDNGSKVKKNLDSYRKEMEEEIRTAADDDEATIDEYKKIIKDKMKSIHWLTEKKELCVINPDLGLWGVLRPKIIGLVAMENRLTYTRNANNDVTIIQGSVLEIRDVLSGAHAGGSGILLNLKLRAAETNWTRIMELIDEIFLAKYYLIQDCNY